MASPFKRVTPPSAADWQAPSPSLNLDQFEDYRIAYERFGVVRSRLRTLDCEIDDLNSRIDAERVRLALEREEKDIQSVLEGGDINIETEPERRLASVRYERDIVVKALTVTIFELDAVKQRRARELAELLRPAHRAAVRRVAKALIELSEANAAEVQIHNTLRTNDLGASRITGWRDLLPTMSYRAGAPGDWKAHYSPAQIWLREARQQGFLAETEDPRAMDAESER